MPGQLALGRGQDMPASPRPSEGGVCAFAETESEHHARFCFCFFGHRDTALTPRALRAGPGPTSQQSHRVPVDISLICNDNKETHVCS